MACVTNITGTQGAPSKIHLYGNWKGRVEKQDAKIASIKLLIKDIKTDISIKINEMPLDKVQQLPFVCKKENEISYNSLPLTLDQIHSLVLKVVKLEKKCFSDHEDQLMQTEVEIPLEKTSQVEAGKKYRLYFSSNNRLEVQAKLIEVVDADVEKQKKELLQYLSLQFLPVMNMKVITAMTQGLNAPYSFQIKDLGVAMLDIAACIEEMKQKTDHLGISLLEAELQKIKETDLKAIYHLYMHWQKAKTDTLQKEFFNKLFNTITAQGLEDLMANFLIQITNVSKEHPIVMETSQSFRKNLLKH